MLTRAGFRAPFITSYGVQTDLSRHPRDPIVLFSSPEQFLRWADRACTRGPGCGVDLPCIHFSKR